MSYATNNNNNNNNNNKTEKRFSSAQQFILQLCNCYKMLVIQRHVSTHLEVFSMLFLKTSGYLQLYVMFYCLMFTYARLGGTTKSENNNNNNNNNFHYCCYTYHTCSLIVTHALNSHTTHTHTHAHSVFHKLHYVRHIFNKALSVRSIVTTLLFIEQGTKGWQAPII
jgi:hypothetical protein